MAGPALLPRSELNRSDIALPANAPAVPNTPSSMAPCAACSVRSWSHPSRTPFSIWIRWISASIVSAKNWLIIICWSSSENNRNMTRPMTVCVIALKIGIWAIDAPNVYGAMATAHAISAASCTSWPMIIHLAYCTCVPALWTYSWSSRATFVPSPR